MYLNIHKYKYRCASGISTFENGSLCWMELTETKERIKVDSAVPYYLLHVIIKYYKSFL